jgi:hypothetical protein
MTTKPGVFRSLGQRGPQKPPGAGSPMTKDRLAIAADQIRITHNRPATGVEAGAEALPKAPGHGWSAWLANVKRRRRLAREERLEWMERLQRLERRKRQSGEYVPDRRHPPHWL